MKTRKDPRHIERVRTIQALFAWEFNQEGEVEENERAKTILKSVSELDKKITTAAPLWPIEKINRIDLAILRQAIFEIEEKQTPEKVIVDEAIEIAKEYGADSSPSFINGVLGKLISK